MARQILHEEKSLSRPIRTAIYARVSTANNGQDPKMQTRELREYCERRGWKFAGEYVDEGISGTKDSRPELNRLMADAHRRRFDASSRLAFRPIRPFRFASAASTGNLQSSRHRIRFTFRASGHEHAHRQDGFHRSGRGGRARTQPDRRARKSWPPERPGQGKAPGKAPCSRGRREGWRPARTRALVARNHHRDGHQQGVCPTGVLWLAQKRRDVNARLGWPQLPSFLPPFFAQDTNTTNTH